MPRRPNPARPDNEVRLLLEGQREALVSAQDASIGSSPSPTPGPGATSWITIDPDNPHRLLYHGAVDDGSHIIHIPVSTIALPDPANPRRILYPLLEAL